MKLISLNTWGGRLSEPLVAFVKQNAHIDILCMQEVFHEAHEKSSHPRMELDNANLLNDLSSALPDHTVYFRPAVGDFYGLVMFIRKELTVQEEGVINVYKSDAEDGYHARELQYARINHQGDSYVVANIHGLWNGGGKEDAPERIEQSKRVAEFLTPFKDEKTVLCGDFNLSPTTESLRMIEEIPLRNLIKEYGVTSTRTSHYEKENRFADYALVSNAVNVHDFKVLPDEVSDHSPLYIEFS